MKRSGSRPPAGGAKQLAKPSSWDRFKGALKVKGGASFGLSMMLDTGDKVEAACDFNFPDSQVIFPAATPPSCVTATAAAAAAAASNVRAPGATDPARREKRSYFWRQSGVMSSV